MKLSRTLILTVIALIFHVVGFVGIGLLHNEATLALTPLHILLMFLLLVISFAGQYSRFLKWATVVFAAGFAIEWVGVHKGWLFGSYGYAAGLGWRWQQVPLLIGANWVIVVAGSVSLASLTVKNKWLAAVVAACIATTYDWALEPVASSLGYWQWTAGFVPLYNYLCWGLASFVFSLLWNYFNLRRNQFAINLFIIQLLFFIALQLFS